MEKYSRYAVSYLKKIYSSKIFKFMRNILLILFAGVFQVYATDTYAQNTRLTLDLNNISVASVLEKIESNSEFYFLYNAKLIDIKREVSVSVENEKISDILGSLFAGTGVNYKIYDNQIILTPGDITSLPETLQQQTVTGKVTDASTNEAMPGVNIQVKGTTIGTISDAEGKYSLPVSDKNTILIFSFIGYVAQEIQLSGRTTLDVMLVSETTRLDEVVVVGYGTMKKSDLTGSVIHADIDVFRNQPNVSILQSLQGSVAGLNIGQINQAGGEPSISVRGRTSISGAQDPLIILDGVIFRGSLNDIMPDDIESVDLLKDNSAAAVYGSQAANGVLVITTISGKASKEKPVINYSARYTFSTPAFELTSQSPEEFIEKNIVGDFLNSRTPESGYLETKPNYDVTSWFKSFEQSENYHAGMATNWYDLMTSNQIFSNDQNLSLTCKTDYLNYFISLGFADEKGYMVGEDFKRYNARINVDSHIKDWLTVGIQSFFALRDNSTPEIDPGSQYGMPFDAAYKWWEGDGTEINPLLMGGLAVNPLAILEEDYLQTRNNYFGNIYIDIDMPFITKGLSYKINFYNNYLANRTYSYEPFANNFQGYGQKLYSNTWDMSSDNILTYKRRFNEDHNVNVTLLYGFEQRKYDNTDANVSIFIDPVLGYNRLQAGAADQRNISSGAWKESSIYSMGRLFYSYRDKYMVTGTFRRDGFSGFSEQYKFGIFPSFALAWIPTEEAFFPDNSTVDYLKLRLSYGSNGNRTIGRYQTLAKVTGGFNYVDEAGNSLYTKNITSLASSELKWETTTGVNVGLDFELFKSRLNGSIEYYSNKTTDLLYNVDIPKFGRYDKFPDNLGKLLNQGIEVTLSSVNIKTPNFSWNSSFVFSRNRDKLAELLGFDHDGDGKEDDLISAGLFIGKPLNVIYHYEITGELYQIGDDIPAYSDIGMYVVVDQNEDGKLDSENDYKILGYNDPSYRFSITNEFKYKNWSLFTFINSIQGGKDYYYGLDESLGESVSGGFNRLVSGEQPMQWSFPKYELYPYWRPENPDAIYQRIRGNVNPGQLANRYTQRNFIRLQDISLSYNFSSNFLDKFNIDNLRLYLSGKNLFTLTKWRGWDPETGGAITRTGRPVLRSYTFGVNINF